MLERPVWDRGERVLLRMSVTIRTAAGPVFMPAGLPGTVVSGEDGSGNVVVHFERDPRVRGCVLHSRSLLRDVPANTEPDTVREWLARA